jgi:MFS family permease
MASTCDSAIASEGSTIEPIEPASDDQRPGTEPTERRWLTRGVGSVGLASFFSDSGHEITTSVLPSFLIVTLRSSAGVLGLIEGVSDALTGLAKLVCGPVANDPERRVTMASGGDLVTAAATGAIGVAATVWQAGALRATAWLARGVRSPARDAMLASLAPPAAYGRAFGLERAGDNLGAVVGPLLAAGLLAWIGIRPTLYLAAIPGLFAALAIMAATREARRGTDQMRQRFRLELSGLRDAGLLRMMLPIAALRVLSRRWSALERRLAARGLCLCRRVDVRGGSHDDALASDYGRRTRGLSLSSTFPAGALR